MDEPALLSPSRLVFLLTHRVRREGLRAFSRAHDLDPGNVSAVLNLRKPMQRKIARALGYDEVKAYRPLEARKRGNGDE